MAIDAAAREEMPPERRHSCGGTFRASRPTQLPTRRKLRLRRLQTAAHHLDLSRLAAYVVPGSLVVGWCQRTGFVARQPLFQKTPAEGSNVRRIWGIRALGLSVLLGVAIGAAATTAWSSPYGAAAWGRNDFGELGDGMGGVGSSGSATPVAVANVGGISGIAAAGFHSLAVLSNGKVMSWGSNANGELGIGNYTGPSKACTTEKNEETSTGCSLVPIEVPGVSGAIAVSGRSHDSMALLSNGSVMAWGENTYGQLGDGSHWGPEACSAQPCETHPHTVGGMPLPATAIAAGIEHSLALTTAGSVEAWGGNQFGQLGDGSFTGPTTCFDELPCSPTPQEVSEIGNATAIAAGGAHSLALLTDGTIRAWGKNTEGQLGNGKTTNSDLPVKVTGISGATAVAAGDAHSLALLSNGTVMAWGWNQNGQLGDGNTTNSDEPVLVSGLTGVTAIAAGDNFSLAVLSNGTVMAWGSSSQGQLGDGGFGQSDVPVSVTGLSGITTVDSEGEHALAIGANLQPGKAPTPSAEEQFGNENPGEPNQRRACAGDPVSCGIGNLTESQTDFRLGGRGLPLEMTRTYNAQAAVAQASPGPFGYGWATSFSDHLILNTEAESVTVVQGNGSSVRFKGKPGQAGEYTAPEWSQAKLVFGEGTYSYTLPRQEVFRFNEQGRLLSEADRNGNTTSLAYSEAGRLETVTDAAGRKLTFGYNGQGLVESVQDPMGHTVKYGYEAGSLTSVTLPGEATPRWQFKYDGSNRLTKLTDGRNGTTTSEYDSSNRVVSQTDPAARTTTFAYGASETRVTNSATGRVTKEIFTQGDEPYQIRRAAETSHETTESFTYDEAGDLASITDGNKHQTRFTYDSSGNKTTTIDPDEHETKWTYNSTHDVETITTPKGETTTIKRDSRGNAESISRPAPGSTTQTTKFEYDSHGSLTKVEDPLKRVWKYEYGSQGDRSAEVDPEGDKQTWLYNEDSQETSSVSPRGNVTGGEPAKYTTKTERDAQGRPIKITDPLGHETKYAYDGDGNVETETDGNSHTTTYTYDADNERTKTKEHNGTVTETGYDGAGQVTSQLDGNKHEVKYVRNILEQVTEVIDPLNRKTIKEYDAAGNVKAVTDPAKRVTTYTYEAANRLQETSYSESATHAVKYQYDADGDRTSVTDGTGTTTDIYDQLDRLTEIKDGHGDVTKYEYDLANEQTKITYPSGKAVTRSFDNAGRLEKVTDWLEHTTKFAYNSDSQLATTTFPSGTNNVDKYAYDEADRMSEVAMTKGAETLASLVYTRDNDGQVKAITSKGLPGEEKPSYEYDANNRLTKGAGLSYEYDNAGNATKAGASTNTYDIADEIKTGTSVTYSYNELGERTKRTPTSGAATSYGYDQAGNLTSVTRPKEGKVAEIKDTYAYDGTLLRASQNISGATTFLVWDCTESVPLILNDGTNSYIYGPGGVPVEQVSGSGTALYLHHDQQGSTRLLTGSSGKSEAAATYDAYGSKTGSTGTATTPLGYDGQYTSADTGLIYLRARAYDPTTAQFLTVDPAAAVTETPYRYAGDNPVNVGDPTGLSTVSSAVNSIQNGGAALNACETTAERREVRREEEAQTREEEQAAAKERAMALREENLRKLKEQVAREDAKEQQELAREADERWGPLTKVIEIGVPFITGCAAGADVGAGAGLVVGNPVIGAAAGCLVAGYGNAKYGVNPGDPSSTPP
jgi:RHS repeat-associated protein